VEDHPIEYGKFEGIIPKGQYGGGAVIIWDRGTWIPEGDAQDGLEKGHLEFTLRGERLKGRFDLVRPPDKGKRVTHPNWLLIKWRPFDGSPLSCTEAGRTHARIARNLPIQFDVLEVRVKQ